jgi:hypothetical protein
MGITTFAVLMRNKALLQAAGSGGRASFSGCLNATAGLRARRFASDFLQIPVVQIPVVAVASKNCSDREKTKSHNTDAKSDNKERKKECKKECHSSPSQNPQQSAALHLW